MGGNLDPVISTTVLLISARLRPALGVAGFTGTLLGPIAIDAVNWLGGAVV